MQSLQKSPLLSSFFRLMGIIYIILIIIIALFFIARYNYSVKSKTEVIRRRKAKGSYEDSQLPEIISAIGFFI